MAMAAGTFYTDEGKQLQTGTETVGHTGAGSHLGATARRGGFSSVSFRGTVGQQQDFAAKDLVILTQEQSFNDDSFVKTRQMPEACTIDRELALPSVSCLLHSRPTPSCC